MYVRVTHDDTVRYGVPVLDVFLDVELQGLAAHGIEEELLRLGLLVVVVACVPHDRLGQRTRAEWRHWER